MEERAGGRDWSRAGWEETARVFVNLGNVTLQCLFSDERFATVLTDDWLGGNASLLLDVELDGVDLPGVVP